MDYKDRRFLGITLRSFKRHSIVMIGKSVIATVSKRLKGNGFLDTLKLWLIRWSQILDLIIEVLTFQFVQIHFSQLVRNLLREKER